MNTCKHASPTLGLSIAIGVLVSMAAPSSAKTKSALSGPLTITVACESMGGRRDVYLLSCVQDGFVKVNGRLLKVPEITRATYSFSVKAGEGVSVEAMNADPHLTLVLEVKDTSGRVVYSGQADDRQYVRFRRDEEKKPSRRRQGSLPEVAITFSCESIAGWGEFPVKVCIGDRDIWVNGSPVDYKLLGSNRFVHRVGAGEPVELRAPNVDESMVLTMKIQTPDGTVVYEDSARGYRSLWYRR